MGHAVSATPPSAAVGPSVPSRMRAWVYRKCGGGASALELEANAEVPTPRKGEVLVRVQASSVNPGDWKVQSGMLRPFLPAKLPFIPGHDVAGEVVQLGTDVHSVAVGDQVFGMTEIPRGGGLGEFAVMHKDMIAHRPPTVPPTTAAAMAVAAGTALVALTRLAGVPREKLTGELANGSSKDKSQDLKRALVTCASGGVGHYAVQLAKAAGLHVTATCGARNADFVKSLGADEVLDYKTPEGQQLQSSSGQPYDLVVDIVQGHSWSTVRRVLSPHGRWVHVAPDLNAFILALWHGVTAPSKRVVTGILEANNAEFAVLAQLSAEGRLKTQIDAEVPFESAPEAWKRSIDGHTVGKLVVVMS